MAVSSKYSNKNLLFKQIDNSHLDEMNYNLWRKASLEILSSEKSSSGKYKSDEESWQVVDASGAVALPFQPYQKLVRRDDFCTISMDMTYDDRIFFGLHNFYQLKRSLMETQCNIDFSTSNNRVSINGGVKQVFKICNMFTHYSLVVVFTEFRFHEEPNLEQVKWLFTTIQNQCEYYNVPVHWRPCKSNSIQIYLFTFRYNIISLFKAFVKVADNFNYYKLGTFASTVKSIVQIPHNRRDLTGRKNSYIDMIQNKWGTNIEIIRYDDCPNYQFENVVITGRDLFTVVNTWLDVISRFSFELKFQVSISEKQSLVDCISKLSYDLKSIFISIEPCPSATSMAISIHSDAANFSKIFQLREQLVQEMKKY